MVATHQRKPERRTSGAIPIYQIGKREHHLNTVKVLEECQDGKLLVLYRQKEADKDAMVFVCNRMSFWEAGILPTELLPLNRQLKYRTNSNLRATPKSASLRIPDSTIPN